MPQETNSDLLKKIEALMGTQTAQINANVDARIEGLRQTVELRLSQIEEKLERVEQENLELKKINSALEERVKGLEEETGGKHNSVRLLQVERFIRQRNIVATGIDFDTPQQGFQKLNNLIGAATDTKIQVTGVRAFKPKNGKGMIVAECKSNEDKQCILRSKKQFVTTDGGEERPVYIDSDLTREDREMQNKLRWKAKEMRQQGKDVRIAMGKLKVDGEWLHLDAQGNLTGINSFRKD